jgi:hypothetical protein
MTDVQVRGRATAEEVAAVLAVLRRDAPPPDAYARWRRTRLAALRDRPGTR